MRLIILITAFALGITSFSCNRLTNENMEHNAVLDNHEKHFTCPMHPEVTGKEGDKCVKCGMTLQEINSRGKVSMMLSTTPSQLEAGKIATLSLKPRDESNDSVVVELEETHEKMIHVIIVNEDLTWFDHIHAESAGDGTYTVNETFPEGGNYLVYADYKPLGRNGQTDKIQLAVRGESARPTHNHETKLVANTDGYTLSIDNANSMTTGSIQFPILVQKDGKNLKRSEIQNYLGAVAHIILVSQDEKKFIHIHPESTKENTIMAHADIPDEGIYRMWVQFQTEGVVHTADFTLDIKGTTNSEPSKHDHAHAAHKH